MAEWFHPAGICTFDGMPQNNPMSQRINAQMNISRFRAVWYLLLIALASFGLTRTLLAGVSWSEAELTPWAALRILGVSAAYDLAFYGYALIPVVLYLWLMPNKIWTSRFNRVFVRLAVFATLYALGFIAVAELLFWDEFGVRFNFISVDYLVYRREVADNINESYPLAVLLTLILVLAAAVYWRLAPKINHLFAITEPLGHRTRRAAGWLVLPFLAHVAVGQDLRDFSSNSYQNELASNGPYQFVAAFKSNELDYDKFYETLPQQEAAALLASEIEDNDAAAASAQPFNIKRAIDNPGTEKRLNIFLVMVESLSADYLGTFGNRQGLTPNLDRLAEESLLFTRFYATGTRTTRGLEAVTLSIPPTPGRSIVKRIGHESGMWSLGNIMQARGYDVRFIYGGRGYFDNMNAFFSGNGYQIIDQSSIPDDEITFSNAWGVSDEDLYRQAIKAADTAAAGGKPFFFHLMTTSNHRPYTYPQGRIDIPSGSGRAGAVKYTDWALGDLLKKVKDKPWFNDTLFVIVADHCAGSAGKVDLPVEKYHIPLFIYAPAQVGAGRIDKIASQIDIAPTLLALMNMDYDSAFFGKDIIAMKADEERALIGNYQKLGLFTEGALAILSPRRGMMEQIHPESTQPEIAALNAPDRLMRRDIAYYQGANYIYKHRLNAWAADGWKKL